MESVRKLEHIVGNGRVAIVDTAMQFKDYVPWQRAITMVVNNEGYTLITNPNGELVRSPSLTVEMPLVVCLNRYVAYRQDHEFEQYATPKPIADGTTVSKHTIRMRDNWTCQYCQQYGDTIDHIFPKSRGGGSTWDNLCVACAKCNGEKRNRTPQEAGMRVPVIPKYGVLRFPALRIHQRRERMQQVQQAIYEELETLLGIEAKSPV